MLCLECGTETDRLFTDVRKPPLSPENCLCAECFLTAVDQAVEDSLTYIDKLEALKYEVDRTVNGEPPYIHNRETVVLDSYNPNYGDTRICECGHTYYRHFDTFDEMVPCGCKYCRCKEFKERDVLET